MRPLLSGEGFPSCTKPRSRKASIEHAAVSSNNVPTTFAMMREEDLGQDSTFGVESLTDTLDAALGSEQDLLCKQRTSGTQTSNVGGLHALHARSASSGSSTKQVADIKMSQRRRAKPTFGSPISTLPSTLPNVEVPYSIPPSAMPSAPTSASLHSIKLSDGVSTHDDVASQAIISSGDEEEHDHHLDRKQSGSSPQLVMPSIQMPTRRPFTTKGKAMGKLKIMVAGHTGAGKTSLIRSILQLCEHIVHVDPLPACQPSSVSQRAKSKPRHRRRGQSSAPIIHEYHASTKPCPPWLMDVEQDGRLRRRKGTFDTVLERNVHFVDTPGFSYDDSELEAIHMVTSYVESLLHQTAHVTSLDDNDVLGIVSGNGGIVVDVVLYLLPPHQEISKDIDFMRRLSRFTNVIPIIGKSDTLSMENQVTLKASILARLQTTSVNPFFFGKALDDALLAVQSLSILGRAAMTDATFESSFETDQNVLAVSTYPFAISSIAGPDDENMDASLLMSPNYVQPLRSSELTVLIAQVFDPESINWLRYSTAKKFLAWRRANSQNLPLNANRLSQLHHSTASVGLAGLKNSNTPSVCSHTSPSGVLIPLSASPPFPSGAQSPHFGSSSSIPHLETLEHSAEFSLARYNQPVEGEQHMTEVRISKWAIDLQRSLRNERERFEELQRADRANWLLERVGEEVTRGTIVTSLGGAPRADWAIVQHGEKKDRCEHRLTNSAALNSHDPLGLCDLSDDMKRKSFVLVKILGGVSVLGAVVVGVVRACGMEPGLPQGGWWCCVTSWVTSHSD